MFIAAHPRYENMYILSPLSVVDATRVVYYLTLDSQLQALHLSVFVDTMAEPGGRAQEGTSGTSPGQVKVAQDVRAVFHRTALLHRRASS